MYVTYPILLRSLIVAGTQEIGSVVEICGFHHGCQIDDCTDSVTAWRAATETFLMPESGLLRGLAGGFRWLWDSDIMF